MSTFEEQLSTGSLDWDEEGSTESGMLHPTWWKVSAVRACFVCVVCVRVHVCALCACACVDVRLQAVLAVSVVFGLTRLLLRGAADVTRKPHRRLL